MTDGQAERWMDGQRDRQTDYQHETIITHHYRVVGYKKVTMTTVGLQHINILTPYMDCKWENLTGTINKTQINCAVMQPDQCLCCLLEECWIFSLADQRMSS